MPTLVNNLNDYRRLLNSRSVVLTSFFADWCAPCQTMAPQLEILERQFDSVLFLQVDVEKAEEVAANQRVRGLPTLTFHVDGQRLEASTIHGVEPQRVYHTLSNLTRVCDYGEEPAAPTLPGQHKFGQSAQKAPAPAPAPTASPQQPSTKTRRRQVLFADKPASNAAPGQAADRVIEIMNMQHYMDEVSSAPGLVVIDFNAPWCLPCRQVKPAFHYLAQQPEYGHVKFLSVNVDNCGDVAAAMEVNSLPTFMIGSQGQQRQSFTGGDAAYLEERIRYWSVNSA